MVQNGQASLQAKYIESIKADFLEKIDCELDEVIEKLKN
jgi:hypothetical protein